MNETEREKLKERINQYVRQASTVNVEDMIHYMGIDWLVNECENVSEGLSKYAEEFWQSPVDILNFYAIFREQEEDISFDIGIANYMDDLAYMRQCGRDEYAEHDRDNELAKLQCEMVVCVFRREIGCHFENGKNVPDFLKLPKPQWDCLLLHLLKDWHSKDVFRMLDLLNWLENVEVKQ